MILSRQNFCRNKQTFAATIDVFFLATSIFLSRQKAGLPRQTRVCRDKSMLVATKPLWRQNYVCHCLSRQKTCFVATQKAHVCRDKNYTYGSSSQRYCTAVAYLYLLAAVPPKRGRCRSSRQFAVRSLDAGLSSQRLFLVCAGTEEGGRFSVELMCEAAFRLGLCAGRRPVVCRRYVPQCFPWPVCWEETGRL